MTNSMTTNISDINLTHHDSLENKLNDKFGFSQLAVAQPL